MADDADADADSSSGADDPSRDAADDSLPDDEDDPGTDHGADADDSEREREDAGEGDDADDRPPLRGVFPRDSSWGHKIVFDDYDAGKVYGWISPNVSEGDRFGYQMESGRVGVFEIVDADRKLDPADMFFAEVEPVGYADDLDYDTDPQPRTLR